MRRWSSLGILCALALATINGWGGDVPAGVTSGTSRELPVHLLRDPFWPIGWAPANFGQLDVGESGEALTKWEEARRLLQVSGLSRNARGKYVAIIKGVGVVEEGDTVSVTYGDLTYKWRIRAITSRGIEPERIGAFPVK